MDVHSEQSAKTPIKLGGEFLVEVVYVFLQSISFSAVAFPKKQL